MADIAEVLWRDHLSHNPSNPNWANRDRFVLSAGARWPTSRRGRARIRVKLGHSVLQLCDTATKSCSRLVLVTIVR
jgi:hypothetical protein